MTSASKQHLVIAGTGRAGTTSLVQLLDRCGFETDSSNLTYYPEARAGLEVDLSSSGAPEVVKSPHLSSTLDDLVVGGFDPQRIKALIIPVRELEDAAASRLERFGSSGLGAAGGLWGDERPSRQKEVLSKAVYELVVTAARHQIPTTLLEFPDFVTNPDNAWKALGPLVSDRVSIEEFRACHAQVMRPEYVHRQQHFGPLALVRLDLRWLKMRTARRMIQGLRRVRRTIASNASTARRV
jgi:hypothetical protein